MKRTGSTEIAGQDWGYLARILLEKWIRYTAPIDGPPKAFFGTSSILFNLELNQRWVPQESNPLPM